MEATREKTLHMIGNAHLDPVWLWTWQEGFQEAKATFRSALDRLREYDDFLFTSSSAAIYEWIERNDPEMFAEIRERVAEGRWEICGGWWIQPDVNIPGGESLVRQGLYGQRYFREKLGVRATTGYNVDSFGHPASLPQILLKSGLTSYVFTRPHPHEKRLPERLFCWESDDGSRVLAFRIPYEYCTGPADISAHVRRCAAEMRGEVDALMCFYGVGNHGGGPTRANIENIQRMQHDSSMPRLVFSTPSRYFQEVTAEQLTLPTVHDELQPHAIGCYAAHSGVKRWNRQAEHLLLSAEQLSCLAMRVTGLPYPCDLDQAWKDVLFNQFHDILAGTSIEPAYEDARNLYGEAMAIAGRALNNAAQSLSWRIGIEQQDGVRPIVVFNPHSWPVRTNVELEFGRLRETDALLDAEGQHIPWQSIRSLATVTSGNRNRLSFIADLPAFGYHTYRLVPDAAPEPTPPMSATDTTIENNHLRLAIDPATGCITSLFGKEAQFEWLRAPAAHPLVLDDRSDTWSHGILSYADVVGEFTATVVQLVEHGPVKSVIRVRSEYGRSHLTQDVTMYADIPQIDVHVTVDWHEQFKLLKLSFPVNVYFSTATYEIPYGHIERAGSSDEKPGQRWVDLSGVGRDDGRLFGLTILNDGKYSYDITEKVINLTVLRSPIYAHHDPYVPQPDRSYTFIDQGVQRFTYSLVPHEGGWQTAGVVKRAAVLNQPPVVVAESCHPGPLPQRDSYLSIDAENVVVSALKRAEDNGDLIVRCFETSGTACTATIGFPHWGRTIEAEFKPSELKTFRVPADEGVPVRETSLIEWDE
jgi:alpha-mannosidase